MRDEEDVDVKFISLRTQNFRMVRATWSIHQTGVDQSFTVAHTIIEHMTDRSALSIVVCSRLFLHKLTGARIM